MNQVVIIGRLTRDVELRYAPTTNNAVAHFTLAVDKPSKQGEAKTADFIRVTVFGKQGENCERFLSKGKQCAVQGRLQSGSYENRHGEKVYTLDVIGERVEFIGSPTESSQTEEYVPSGFNNVDEDIPF